MMDVTTKSIGADINTRIRFSFIQLYDSSRFLIFSKVKPKASRINPKTILRDCLVKV